MCTVLKLADNSSWLEFSDGGHVNSLINRADLQNKYNGGMCLGNFNYSNGSEIVSNLIELPSSLFISSSLLALLSNIDTGIVGTSLLGLSTIGSEFILGLIMLPIVFFNSMDVVGEPDGYVDNYWKTHNITDSQGISVIEVNQIRTPQEKYYNYVGSSLIKASQNQYKYSLISNGPENGTNPIEKLGENIRNHLDSAKSEFNKGNYLKALKELGWLNAAGFGISLYIVAENEEVIVKIIERFS